MSPWRKLREMNIHRAGFEGMGRLTRWVNVDYLRKMMINLNPNGDLMIIAFKAFEFWPISFCPCIGDM